MREGEEKRREGVKKVKKIERTERERERRRRRRRREKLIYYSFRDSCFLI